MKSIIQKTKKCWVCGSTSVHEHHIFFGSANRKKSEQYGMKVWLCPRHHNMSNQGVHFDKQLDLYLKRYAQLEFEKTHTREEFIEVFGKSYL